MKDNYLKIESLWTFLRDKISSGSYWPEEVEDKDGNLFISLMLDSNIEYQTSSKKRNYGNIGDYFLVCHENLTITRLSEEEFLKNYKKTDKSDYYQILTAAKILKLTLSVDDLYEKASHNNYRHNREVSIINMAESKMENSQMSDTEFKNFQTILNARNRGEHINFRAISEFGCNELYNNLNGEETPYFIVDSLFEEDLENEHDFNIDEIVKNDQDNLIVFLQQDQYKLDEMIADARINEIMQKSVSVDNLTVDELIILRDQIMSLKNLNFRIPNMQNKISSLISTLDKVAAQMAQEIQERREMYKDEYLNKDKIDKEEELDERDEDELVRTLY